jgi:histidine triad (HIT) family protein
MEKSIFTKIIGGEIPSLKVYEDDLIYAFLDRNPIQPGHTLVVSKIQVAQIWDLPDDSFAALFKASKVIAGNLKKVLGVPRVGVQVVGVDVPHAHIHLIPFTTIEEYRNVPNEEDRPSNENLKLIADKIKF